MPCHKTGPECYKYFNAIQAYSKPNEQFNMQDIRKCMGLDLNPNEGPPTSFSDGFKKCKCTIMRVEIEYDNPLLQNNLLSFESISAIYKFGGEGTINIILGNLESQVE